MPKVALQLAPGARVEIRDEEWVVRSIKAEASGGQAVRVTGVSELVRGKDAIFLTKLDEVAALAPEETELVADTSSRFVKTRLYLESLLRRSPASDESIHLGHLAAIDPAEYQLRPASRALGLLRPRFLMADGVGLGKTIEVGVLLTELIRRGRGRRILVVCMKSILAQFQEELWARFTIPLVRLDSVGIQRVQAQVPSSMNPFHYFDRVIVSIDTLKNDVKYRQHLENCRWDAIVIDECQNIAMRTKSARGQASQRYQLARLLAKQCDALLFTSATPHDGSAASFASIIRLLEPTAIADVDSFEAEDVQHFIQRKFKKDVAHEVAKAFPERETSHEHLDATEAENRFFDTLESATFETLRRRRTKALDEARGLFPDAAAGDDPKPSAGRGGGVLFRTTLLKAFLSSPEACISTIDARLSHKALDVEEKEGEKRAAAQADRDTLTNLRSLAEAASLGGTPKYAALKARVADVVGDRSNAAARVVIFSERIQTLEFLRDALARDLKLRFKDGDAKAQAKNQIAIFHGSLDDTSQMDLVKSFGSADSPLRVLLASDAAAEGINLHYYCHNLIHYDLPWSLITLVQRNGRIDRFGQKNTPCIHYLLTRPASDTTRGDLRVLERLMEKESQVQANLGDPASLMNLHSSEAEEEQIALAAQGELAPEEALPDIGPEASDSGGGGDWFTEMFSGAPAEPPISVAPRVSLFETDLDFAREAFEAVVTDADDAVVWQDRFEGFDLAPPSDLKLRYDYLPRELTRDRKRFRLTTDRGRVMQSIEIARAKESEWPEWELFWPHHPVCEWLDDQVLSHLGRHEASVVEIPKGLDGDDAIFLFQGVYSNGNSQAVLIDWFGVPFRSGAPGTGLALDDVLRRTGFAGVSGNPGSVTISEALISLRSAAVQAAKEHMADLRMNRAESVSEPLRQGTRELKAWKEASLRRLENEELGAAKGTAGAPAAIRSRVKAEKAEVEALFRERFDFINRLRTNKNPYLRLAAVFTAPA